MTTSRIILIITVAFLVLAGCNGTAMMRATRSPGLKAGFAVRIINPSEPALPMGHSGKTSYSDVHADLRVQAMAIEDDRGNRIIWMGWDNIGTGGKVLDRVQELVREKYNVAPESFCINATHTHSAPALAGREGAPIEQFNPEYADFVVEQAVAVAGEALANLTPAVLKYHQDMCTSVAINRRRPPTYFLLPYIEGTVDHKVQIVTAESTADGRLLGLIAEYACHPVTVGPTSLGSDYPGFMRKFVEKRHPDAVVVFLQGCGGNIRPQIVNDDVTKWGEFKSGIKIADYSVEKAKEFGRDLGMAVERALNTVGQPVHGPVEAEYAEIELPSKKKPGETIPFRIQAFRLGADSETPFTMIALQGEVFVEYSLALEKILQPANTMVLSYSNHSRGYICTAAGIEEGGYECPKCPVTGAAEPMILDAAAELARPK